MWRGSAVSGAAAKNVLDEGRFGLGVGVSVPAESLCQAVLEACIIGADLATGTQVVPEPQFVLEAGKGNKVTGTMWRWWVR
jgi:hypothetical protein